MRAIFQGFLLTAALSCVSGLVVYGQDAPSLGDIARQARREKQNKETPSKVGGAAKTSKVITNEEIPEHSEPVPEASAANGQGHGTANSRASAEGAKRPAEEWKSQIKAQKQVVTTLQGNIDKLNDSIQFAPGNCVSGCVQWNEHQQQKQQEVERMRAQLEIQKKQLQEMQESARQQGYGSSVSDP